jgi:hypothetical protein
LGTGSEGSSATYQIIAFVPAYLPYADRSGKNKMDIAMSLSSSSHLG